MNTTNASEAIPSSQAFTLVGVTYGLYGFGLFLLWPALIGVVIAYVKRKDVPEIVGVTLPLADQHVLVVADRVGRDHRRDAVCHHSERD